LYIYIYLFCASDKGDINGNDDDNGNNNGDNCEDDNDEVDNGEDNCDADTVGVVEDIEASLPESIWSWL